MKSHKLLPFLLVSFLFSIASHGQKNKTVDYLTVPGPVVFNKQTYQLSWSSHPSANFYKQEYIQKGDSADRFTSMVLLDVMTGNVNVKSIAAAKLAELKKMKESNPVINYNSFNNPATGEYMIDFLLTANGADGKMSIAERNVYRYVSFTDKAGKKGVLLFGVSTRSYGDDITPFLVSLKTTKQLLVNEVAAYKVPAIKLVK